jgi:enterochelin esterase-like enzyme
LNSAHQQPFIIRQNIESAFLQREVTVSVILPLSYAASETYSLLLMNDGQDFEALGLAAILGQLQLSNAIVTVIVVGIHAGENRLSEYGTIGEADYANRGDRAGETRDFVLNELIPFLKERYLFADDQVVYAGFSLGGLMALDSVWNHNDIFCKAAVFSGALWWRRRAIEDGYNNADRIMHSRIRDSHYKPGLQFWFQCGGRDETDDRDGDGVIDSVQDTLECIGELERKGYRWNKDIRYLEMPLGEHNCQTWAQAMPDFLIWAFGKSTKK